MTHLDQYGERTTDDIAVSETAENVARTPAEILSHCLQVRWLLSQDRARRDARA